MLFVQLSAAAYAERVRILSSHRSLARQNADLSSASSTRVEQAADPKMHVLSGALVAQPRYLLLVLNNYSPDSNKLTVHRKHD